MPMNDLEQMMHVDWLVDTGTRLTTLDGSSVPVFEFKYEVKDTEVFSAWASHFRNHYCLDAEIDILREGTGLSRADYLLSCKFPSSSRGFGPGIRSGDFGEILIADYLEFILNFWVPRTRYDRKTIQDESTKGSDLIGFKFVGEGESPEDILAVFEVKAQFSGKTAKPKLQEAVTDSAKDERRMGESLNAIKQRLLDKNSLVDVTKVARFQNPVDKPYKELSGAAALFTSSAYDATTISSTDTSSHPNKGNLMLLVIRGDELMKLTHLLYETAANEA